METVESRHLAAIYLSIPHGTWHVVGTWKDSAGLEWDRTVSGGPGLGWQREYLPDFLRLIPAS